MQNCDHTLRTLNFIRRIKETPNVSVLEFDKRRRCNLPRRNNFALLQVYHILVAKNPLGTLSNTGCY